MWLLRKYKKMWYLFKFLWPSQNTYRNFRRNSYKWKLLSRWNSIVLHSPKTVWRCENYYATQYCEVFQFRQPNFSRRRSNLKRNFEVVFLQNHVVVVVLHNWIKFYMKSHFDLNSLLISRNVFLVYLKPNYLISNFLKNKIAQGRNRFIAITTYL